MSATTPKQARVLVADDDPTIILLLEHALEGLRLEYDAAEDGDAAWRLWEEKRHALALLDIEMPGVDGLEICRRIRGTEADGERRTFVMMVTGRDRAADLESGLDAGADDYVSKPATGPQIVARLRIALRRMQEEETRRALHEELQGARWMAGVGEALVALQHEINNPLAGLLATAELVLMNAEEEGRPTRDLKVMVTQARRLTDLVRRIADTRDPKSVLYAGSSRMIDLSQKR